MNPELRERLALKIASIRTRIDWPSWTSTCLLPSGLRDECLSDVDALLTELEAAGWPATPEVPSEEMMKAALETDTRDVQGGYFDEGDVRDIYTAMLRARPKP